MLYCALCDLNQLVHFVGSVAIAQVFYCFDTVFYCCHHFVRMCAGELGELFVVDMYYVYETFVVGGFYVVPLCSVVFR